MTDLCVLFITIIDAASRRPAVCHWGLANDSVLKYFARSASLSSGTEVEVVHDFIFPSRQHICLLHLFLHVTDRAV